MNNLEPTADARVFQTQWFVNPANPLIENKIYYSKSDNLLFYVTAHRGPTTDNLPASLGKPASATLFDAEGFADTSTDCLNALIKYLDKPL